MSRTTCRHCDGPLTVTLANVPGHCRRCERASAREIVTVPSSLLTRLREQIETREIVRAE